MEQTSVVKQSDPIMDLLAAYKPAIRSVLPSHLTPERMLRLAHQAVVKIPKLRQCTPISLINSVIEISTLGLDIGRTAHIIPYKEQATVIIDYKGIIELAHKSDKVASTPMKPVYTKDLFDYQEGTDRWIKHKPARKERGQLVAAYAIVNFKDGSFDFEVVEDEDIILVKARAPGAKKKESPWNTEDEWTMWCKTAMRRLAKRIPQSPQLQRAAYLEDLVHAGLKQDIGHIYNGDGITPTVEKTETIAESTIDPAEVKKDVQKKIDGLKADGKVEKETEKPINMDTLRVGDMVRKSDFIDKVNSMIWEIKSEAKVFETIKEIAKTDDLAEVGPEHRAKILIELEKLK